MRRQIKLSCTVTLILLFYILVLYYQCHLQSNRELSIKPNMNHSSYPNNIQYLIQHLSNRDTTTNLLKNSVVDTIIYEIVRNSTLKPGLVTYRMLFFKKLLY